MFKGKTVLVTGGSRGIGRGIAISFGRLGANVCINYASNADAASKTMEDITLNGGIADIFKADVANEVEVKDMISSIEEKLGGVDILVNNAGITKDTLLMRMKSEDFDAVINSNLKGTFNCTKAVLKYMMKVRYGKIINISSVVGATGNIGQANYVSSKSGIVGFTKASALELAARGIRVNAVAPGFIDTEMTAVLSDEIKNSLVSKIALGYFGKPEDIAETVVFLASSGADYITGQTIHVNGGMFFG